MVVALHPLNDSCYSGIPILSKDGDDNVDVEVYLGGQAGGEIGTPAP